MIIYICKILILKTWCLQKLNSYPDKRLKSKNKKIYILLVLNNVLYVINYILLIIKGCIPK